MTVPTSAAASDLALDNILDQGLARLASRSLATPADLQAVEQLHDEILTWTEGMRRTVQATTDLVSVQGWGWLPFHDDASVRVGLLNLHHGRPISIHDHPGSTGLLVVLEGALRVTNYRCDMAVDPVATSQMVNLTETGQQYVGAGEFATFDPVEGNIHAVTAETPACVVLDILLSPYREEERGWYMPIDDRAVSKQKFPAMRLHRRSTAGRGIGHGVPTNPQGLDNHHVIHL